MIRISMLWLMWLGGCLYDAVCSAANFFPNHTPQQRFDEDFAVASFIVAAWILTRWIMPAYAISRPERS